jgi:hypothetical protein
LLQVTFAVSTFAGVAMKSSLDSIIDDLVITAFGDRTLREQFLFRESLHNLVRLAQAEQMHDIRTSVSRLTGVAAAYPTGRKVQIDGF